MKLAEQLPPSENLAENSANSATLRRALRGDLDNIVLKALRKEPERRYTSAEKFAEDIRRHLEGLPVIATQSSWSYRASKFVTRHKAGVLATALIAIAVLGGIAATIREARIAAANQQRAERRFNDVRKLANSLIFEVNDSIETIPGTTQPRKLILDRALEYLDSLTKESANEPDLQRELAAGYLRIASLQGNAMQSNLGDVAGALTSFQKAMALREAVARSNPGNSKDQIELATTYSDYSDFQSGSVGNPRVGLEYTQKAVAILDRERVALPDDLKVLNQSVWAYITLGELQTGESMVGTVGTVSAGADALQKALLMVQHAIQLSPADVTARRRQGTVYLALGGAEVKLGDRPAALNYYQRAVETYNSLNVGRNDIRIANNLVVAKQRIAEVLLMEGKTSEAIASFKEVDQEARQLAASDPHNELLQRNVVAASAVLGHALVEGGRREEGTRYIRQVLAPLEARPSQTPLIRTFEAQAHAWIGEAAERSGRLDEAAQEYAKGKEILAATRAGANSLRMQVYFAAATDRLAAVYLKLGDVARAQKEYDESLALLELLGQANPDNMEVLYALAETYTGEGNVAMKLAETSSNSNPKAASWKSACGWFQKSQTTWSKVPHPARISTSYLEVTLPAEVARRLATCNTSLASLNHGSAPQ